MCFLQTYGVKLCLLFFYYYFLCTVPLPALYALEKKYALLFYAKDMENKKKKSKAYTRLFLFFF